MELPARAQWEPTDRGDSMGVGVGTDGRLIYLGGMTSRYLQEHAGVEEGCRRAHTARWIVAHGPSTRAAGGTAAVAGVVPLIVWTAFWLPPTTPVWSFLFPVALGLLLAFGVTPAVEAAIEPPVPAEQSSRHVDWGKVHAVRGQAWAVLPPQGSREGNLARRVANIHDRLVQSPIWGSSLLDTHNVRVDPAAEVVQVAQRLSRLADLRGRLRRTQATAPTEAIASQLAALEQVHDSITRRVDALATYESQVHALAEEHRRVTALVAAGDHTDEVLDLLSETARDAITIDHLNLIGNEVGASHEVMQGLVDAMTAPLQILAKPVDSH